MNSIHNADGDPKRGLGAEILSKNEAKKPILLVEGKLELRILKLRWHSGPVELRAGIRIRLPKDEDKTKDGVIKEIQNNVDNKLYFGLVDMDYDFERKHQRNIQRLFDTHPLVTFPTYAYTDDDAAKKVIRSIFDNFKIHENQNDILKLSKILTIIKLFKGKHSVHEKPSMFRWEEIKFSEFNDSDLLYHVANEFEIGPNYEEDLRIFCHKYRKEIEKCGINDHMLFNAWKKCYEFHTNADGKKLEPLFKKIIKERLTDKKNYFIDSLKGNILEFS